MISSGPLLFAVSAVPASGMLYLDGGGSGPVRIVIKNVGASVLTTCEIDGGPDSDHLAPLDTSTFSSLGAGSVKQLWLDRPIHILALSPVGNTTLDITVTS